MGKIESRIIQRPALTTGKKNRGFLSLIRSRLSELRILKLDKVAAV